MPTIQVTVTVPELDENEIREALLQAIIDQVLYEPTERRFTESGRREQEHETTLVKRLREMVWEHANENIRTFVKDSIVAEAERVLTAEFRPTNFWGDSAPAATTLRDMILNYSKAYLGETVDGDGRRSSSGYGRTYTRIEYLVRTRVDEVFQKELLPEVQNAARAIKAGLVGKLSEAITKQAAIAVAALLNLKVE